MTPSFALDLSPDGIRLLYRAAGGWTVVGDVALEDPALARRLAALRTEAERLAGGPVATEVVIPPSQIRYATVPRPAAAVPTAADLAPAIAGLTALDPAEIAFDWALEEEAVRLALVDRQTLAEAETFAAAYGFNPRSFGARPTPAQFPRAPDFGPARRAVAVPVAPPPEARAAAEPRLDAADAERLAQSLSARAAAQSSRPRSAWLPAAALAACGLVAVLALALGRGAPQDPAASGTDTAPDIALALPALAAPVLPEAAPLPPAAADSLAVAAPTALLTPPEAGTAGTGPAADTRAPAALPDVPRAAQPSFVAPPWPAPPVPEATAAIVLAALDPVTLTRDAIALPAVAGIVAEPPASLPRPSGSVPAPRAAPAEVVVTLGAPPLAPPIRAAESEPEPDEALATAAEPDVTLPDGRPRARPPGLVERNERATLGGRTRAEMAALRPLARPVSEQTAAVVAAPAPPSDYAVARSPQPRNRPADFATRIATAQAVAAALAAPPPAPPAAAAPAPAPAPQVAAAAPPPAAAPAPEDEYDDGETDVAAAAPNIPTSASVARQATIRNAISLRDINLIGVYGTERDRRALVRLSSGRYVKVRVGDRLDGGQIAAIGRDELRYVKGGRNVTLQLPSG